VFNHLADQEAVLEIFEAAASEGKRVYTFGNWTPYEVHPHIIISSRAQDFGLLFERILNDMHAGREVPRDLWMSIRDGAIRLKAGQELINPEVASVLHRKRIRAPDLGEVSVYEFVMRRFEQLRDGDYQPFTGPIVDQRGRLRLPEGVSNSTWEFRSNMDWLVDNVEGRLPTR
jgi:basic membrane protein A